MKILIDGKEYLVLDNCIFKINEIGCDFTIQCTKSETKELYTMFDNNKSFKYDNINMIIVSINQKYYTHNKYKVELKIRRISE